MTDIGKKIRKYRKDKGLTQEDLAKQADIPYATLMKIESGSVTNPTIKTVKKLADGLDVSLDELTANEQTKIKAVVFDLDGVYFESGTENFINSLMNKFNLTQEEIEEVYFKSDEMQKFKRGEISSDDFWSFAVNKWNIQASKEDLVDMLLSGYSVKPSTQSYVEKLKSEGIKTAICTNNFSDRFEGLKDRFELDKYFDVIVTSYKFGITKPNKEIFNHLANELNLKSAEIVMSDDREVNVDALKELGFEAFLYTSWDDFKQRVNNLLELKYNR